jgi:hypothetical protein
LASRRSIGGIGRILKKPIEGWLYLLGRREGFARHHGLPAWRPGERERALVRVEHHLLALARIGARTDIIGLKRTCATFTVVVMPSSDDLVAPDPMGRWIATDALAE